MANEAHLKKQPKFCATCGKELIPKTNPAGFDALTGKKKFKHYLICPKSEEPGHDIHFIEYGDKEGI